MGEDSKLGSKIKAQITRFGSRLTEGMDKVKRRLVGEMLYGIHAAKDIKVSEVARSLGEDISAEDAARWCKMTFEKTVEVEREGYTQKKHLKMGVLPVRLPERPDIQLWLVVIRGLAPHPILLLTNVAPPRGKDHAEWIADIYLTRWKCEEAYRFIKQSYRLEDVRVRSYTALRNTYALVHAVFYFVSVVVGTKTKLNRLFKKVCEKAKRFYEVTTFFQYAIADGIHSLLFASRTGPHEPPTRPFTGQLTFDFLNPLL